MGKLRYLSAIFHPSLVEGCPGDIKCQAFPGHPAYGLNKFPQPSGKSHQEGEQITRGGGGGSFEVEALSAKGELRGGLKRNEAEQPQPLLLWQPNIIHRCNQRKPKAVPFPEIRLL